MNTLDFYDVDKQYVLYLKKVESDKRGFTKVPDMDYIGKSQKFLCGVVLKINDFEYYVPVSSNKKDNEDSILIVFSDDKYDPVKGSLIFRFMFPVPKEYINKRIISNEPDSKRRLFLNRQLQFCLKNEERIINQARRTYIRVVNNLKPSLIPNACDFKLLEEAALEYSTRDLAGIH